LLAVIPQFIGGFVAAQSPLGVFAAGIGAARFAENVEEITKDSI
jgi:hypothetical protein